MERTIRLIVQYDMEEEVYLKTDPENLLRIVTGFKINPNNIAYILTCGTSETYHYDFEIK